MLDRQTHAQLERARTEPIDVPATRTEADAQLEVEVEPARMRLINPAELDSPEPAADPDDAA